MMIVDMRMNSMIIMTTDLVTVANVGKRGILGVNYINPRDH